MRMIGTRFYLSSAILCLVAGCSPQNSSTPSGVSASSSATPVSAPIPSNPTAKSPFKMTADFKFKKLASQHENRVHITVYLRHEGIEPSWWSEDNPGPSASLQKVRFVDRNGKEYPVKDYHGESGHYIQEKQTRVMLYNCAVPKGYDLSKPGLCKGTVVVYAKVPPSKNFQTIDFSEQFKLP